MKKQISTANELEGDFIKEKSKKQEKLNSNKKTFRQGVIFNARANGELPEVEVKSLSDGKEQVQKAKQEKNQVKKKSKVVKLGFYGTLIGIIAMGAVYLGINKKPNVEPEVNNNGINSSEVAPTNNTQDTQDPIQNNTQNSTVTPGGSTSNSNGSNGKRNTKPNSSEVITDKSDVRDTIDNNNYKTTGEQSTKITIEEDNGNTQQKIDEANQKGDKVEEFGEGITVIIDKQPIKNNENNNNTVPTTPSTPNTNTNTNTTAPTNPGTTAPSTIDTTNDIDVPSAASGLGENETGTYVQTNEPTKGAEDDLLDQFLER